MGKTDPFLPVVNVGFGAAQFNPLFQAIHHPIIRSISNQHSWHANQSEAASGQRLVLIFPKPSVADVGFAASGTRFADTGRYSVASNCE
jgi:hypothetical protein